MTSPEVGSDGLPVVVPGMTFGQRWGLRNILMTSLLFLVEKGLGL